MHQKQKIHIRTGFGSRRHAALRRFWFWAYGGATHSITPALEVSYLVLSSVWWCGIGATLWPSNKVFGALTIALGVFAFWDALLTALEPVPFALYLTAAPKLPLSILWDFALGYVLLRRVYLSAGVR